MLLTELAGIEKDLLIEDIRKKDGYSLFTLMINKGEKRKYSELIQKHRGVILRGWGDYKTLKTNFYGALVYLPSDSKKYFGNVLAKGDIAHYAIKKGKEVKVERPNIYTDSKIRRRINKADKYDPEVSIAKSRKTADKKDIDYKDGFKDVSPVKFTKLKKRKGFEVWTIMYPNREWEATMKKEIREIGGKFIKEPAVYNVAFGNYDSSEYCAVILAPTTQLLKNEILKVHSTKGDIVYGYMGKNGEDIFTKRYM